MIYTSVEQLIGHTPLVEALRLEKQFGLKARLLLKLESFNPGGSAKDRPAKTMLDEAEKKGLLKPGATVIEPTSGNTGIGLAMVAVPRGYRVIIVMPDTMSPERRSLMKAFGAELVLTPGAQGMSGSIAKAEELAASLPGSFIPGQFDNPDNAKAHYLTTGPEIWEDTEGKVDIFVASVGTGGTITGTGHFLKEKKTAIRVVAVEPAESPLLSGGAAAPHRIQGIGANFIPAVLDRNVFDSVAVISGDEAYETARLCSASEGLLVGISSGATLLAAIREAQKEENTGKTVVALMTDTGERYLSSLFA